MSAHDDDPANTRHLDCRKLVTLLGEYVDDQLPGEMKHAMEGHLSQCAPCVAFLRQYRFAPEQAREALLKKVPEGLEDRLLSFLKDRCKK